ncbi:transcriptional regulator [Sorangium cellulosum]|uniref:Transcriptional regulator n=1 Tax=Sorangium cellulosum TaxID=56 RepID=A0A2L0EW69_SORCE|nr:AraC family transcriptional regulator [Sorangium cellulosum]AUX43534.1 transcriptional regulator [Sorangium cellulosum]
MAARSSGATLSSANEAAEELLRAAYRPLPTLARLLERLLRSLAEATGALEGSLWLRAHGTLALRRSGRDLHLRWVDAPDAPRLASLAPAAQAPAITEPIVYGGASIGELRLSLGADLGQEADAASLCRSVSRASASLVKRHEVERWAEERLGEPAMLIGVSAAVRAVDTFIERAAASRLPVLIQGELGTEKEIVAASLHSLGPDRGGPFVVVHDPGQLQGDALARLSRWFEQARGGTLLVDGVDELPPPAQSGLLELLRAGQSLAGSAGERRALPRIIGASTSDLHGLVREGQFSKPLLMRLDFLSISLPPLRARREDIEALVAWVLHRYGHPWDRKSTEELIGACQAYAWPENLAELERAVVRLAVMTGAEPIRRADILEHTPWIASAPARAVGGHGGKGAAPRLHHPPLDEAACRWARMVLAKDSSQLPTLHDGLGRALVYLGEHYVEPIALAQLARHARVSASHLSYLFKSSLGMSFKPFLGRLRVERAKQLLESSRQRITDVAIAVGFADLSYFEKLFRRLVGVSPRVYRRHTAPSGRGDGKVR